ncbi:hypothetical protein J6590_030793 [Homalodisca vitripennis]|nr:hypothetical protein J6590_030793 [Homalodisca vitripennis]
MLTGRTKPQCGGLSGVNPLANRAGETDETESSISARARLAGHVRLVMYLGSPKKIQIKLNIAGLLAQPVTASKSDFIPLAPQRLTDLSTRTPPTLWIAESCLIQLLALEADTRVSSKAFMCYAVFDGTITPVSIYYDRPTNYGLSKQGQEGEKGEKGLNGKGFSASGGDYKKSDLIYRIRKEDWDRKLFHTTTYQCHNRRCLTVQVKTSIISV